ncbi:MAG: N-acetylmuramoyl-L-alanine amidase [Candidatus Egerieousia sp.]|nr:N-acetylmuramoyl-L-alanine amidase [bacterium]MDY5254835.1 N-acetylmuramoyl-L-alanine amidase [Candidatus Egerieousia sp.]
MPSAKIIVRELLTTIATIALICAFIFTASAEEGAQNSIKIKTVVLDAGHGGKDTGAISKNGAIKEKDITLSVALKLGKMINSNYPDVKVVYTRKRDEYIELSKRAEIANRNKADLFISIHVNSQKGTTATGTETFVMGTHKSSSNFEICKLENSVIVLEEDYQSKYEGFDPNSPESYIIFSLLQNTHLEQSLKFAALIQDNFKLGPIKVNRGVKQGGLLVLWKTTMPAVLTEIGFISNPAESNQLRRDAVQSQIAARIFNAFAKYKTDYEGGAPKLIPDNEMPSQSAEQQDATVASAERQEVAVESAERQEATVAETAVQDEQPEAKGQPEAKRQPAASGKAYRIQILSVTKVLPAGAPDLKGRRDAYYIYANKAYKYCIGEYATREEAAADLPKIRKQFSGAFIIFAEK